MRSILLRRPVPQVVLATLGVAVAAPVLVGAVRQPAQATVRAVPRVSPITAPAHRPVLLIKMGARGDRVRFIQRRLKLDDDGIFGPLTRAAVIRFQRQQKLDPDGLVGPITWARLREPKWACIVGGRRKVTDSFGAPRSGGRKHMGIDVFAAYGSPVRAVGRGVVVRSYRNRLGGRSIILSVRRDRFYYAHQSKNLVHDGQVVRPGQVIGRVGTSGNARGTSPHVHFERWKGRKGRIVDPYPLVHRICR
jgi:murein DD-endopeptidase MepM/ murein hydrolase activator NlpD